MAAFDTKHSLYRLALNYHMFLWQVPGILLYQYLKANLFKYKLSFPAEQNIRHTHTSDFHKGQNAIFSQWFIMEPHQYVPLCSRNNAGQYLVFHPYWPTFHELFQCTA